MRAHGLRPRIGGCGGYTIEPRIYVGGMFDFFFRDSAETPVSETSFSAWMLMAEGGYDFGVLESLVLRPVLALGVVGVAAESCLDNNLSGRVCNDLSDTDFEIGLGGQVLYAVDPLTVGGEIRAFFGNIDVLMFGVNVGAML